jgi:hypothetical protein
MFSTFFQECVRNFTDYMMLLQNTTITEQNMRSNKLESSANKLMLVLTRILKRENKGLVWQKLSKQVMCRPVCSSKWPIWCEARRQYFLFSKVPVKSGTTKTHRNGLQKEDGGKGLCLQSQGDQDLCATTPAEWLIFNTSSEHQTVDLSNKCVTKDFLRDFHHGWSVCRTRGQYVRKKHDFLYSPDDKLHSFFFLGRQNTW